MDKQPLVKLFNDHDRANHQLWRGVMVLSDKQFTQALSAGSPSIRAQVVRMVANENLWVNYLWHGEVEFLQEAQFPTRASIREEWDALEEERRDFLDELSPAAFDSRVELAFLNTGGSRQVWEILLQIIHDAAASRAQVHRDLHRVGCPAPTQDFIDHLSVEPVQTYARFRTSNDFLLDCTSSSHDHENPQGH